MSPAAQVRNCLSWLQILKKTFMHLEDQIKLLEQKINLFNQNQQILINKLDLVLKGKVTKEEFSLEGKDYATVKELAYHKKKSIRAIFKCLANYKSSIKRKKVEGVRDHLVNIIDFNNAWEKGNKSFTREVFNKTKKDPKTALKAA